MNLYVGIFDYVVFVVILIANILIWKRPIGNKAGCLLGLAIFGFALPLISIAVEISNYQEAYIDKPFDDSFEMLYAYSRFPIYWILGVLQVAVLALKNKFRKKD